MDLNITLFILFVTGLVGMILGFKRGFAKVISGFIAGVATLFMLGLFLRIYYTYTNGQTMDMVITVIVLIVFGGIYGILKLLTKSVKAIANLPIIAVIDKLLGAFLGVVFVIAIFHLVVKASSLGFLGKYGYSIVEDVKNDEWLTWIVRYDVIEMFTIWKNSLIETFN